MSNEDGYLAVCTSGVVKMKNVGDEDAGDQTNQRQARSPQHTGTE